MSGTVTRLDLGKVMRWRRTAATGFSKAAHGLAWGHRSGPDGSREFQWLIGYESARLLEEVLEDAMLLVPLLHVDGDTLAEHEELERKAKALAGSLRRQRVAAALGNTEGRTPQEAAAFRAKAEQLRRPPL